MNVMGGSFVNVMGGSFVNGLNSSWAAIIWFVLKQFVSTKHLSEFIRHESFHHCRMLLIFALMNCLHNIFTKMWVRSCLSLTYFNIYLERCINPLKPKLNPICCLLAVLGAHHFLHVSRIRVKSLTFRRLMSYIYGAPILDVSRSHTTTQHSR